MATDSIVQSQLSQAIAVLTEARDATPDNYTAALKAQAALPAISRAAMRALQLLATA